MKNMHLGALKFDTVEFASRANAVLGIRDSGKSYTATGMAEQLLDSTALKGHGIPFVAFDPAGIWRFLRVPGKGKGYPVVVVGGKSGDLPLRGDTVGKIVEAALQGRVSLVIDLSGDVSKSEMRRIVTECVGVLMKKNAQYGLRHVFIEEAAEFVPQKPRDNFVYEAVERLVRVGGNMGLGVTLINPRTQNLNKEVLELCDNIFLHRQRGKKSLENLKGWFDAVGAEESRELSTGVSKLGSGECFAWLRDLDQPKLVKVQEKNSHHPNRRDLQASTGKRGAKRVDASEFIKGLTTALPQIEAEIKANDPTALKAEVAALKKELATKSAVTVVNVDRESAAHAAGYKKADDEATVYVQRLRRDFEKILNDMKTTFNRINGSVGNAQAALTDLLEKWPTAPEIPKLNGPGESYVIKGKPVLGYKGVVKLAESQGVNVRAISTAAAVAVAAGGVAAEIGGGALKMLQALATRAPARYTAGQWALLVKIKKGGSTWRTYLSRLRSAGLIDENAKGFTVSAAGAALANVSPSAPESPAELLEKWCKAVGGGAASMLRVLAGIYPRSMTSGTLCDQLGMADGGSTFRTYRSRLKANGLIEITGQGELAVTSFLMTGESDG